MAAFAINREQAARILAKSRWVKAPLVWAMAFGSLLLNALHVQEKTELAARQVVVAVLPIVFLVAALLVRRHARQVLEGKP